MTAYSVSGSRVRPGVSRPRSMTPVRSYSLRRRKYSATLRLFFRPLRRINAITPTVRCSLSGLTPSSASEPARTQILQLVEVVCPTLGPIPGGRIFAMVSPVPVGVFAYGTASPRGLVPQDARRSNAGGSAGKGGDPSDRRGHDGGRGQVGSVPDRWSTVCAPSSSTPHRQARPKRTIRRIYRVVGRGARPLRQPGG